MKHQFSPILEGMEMSKSEHDWLEQRFEHMTVKEALLFRGAMQIESPRDIQTAIQILQGLDYYQLLYGAEDDVLLGRFVMEHIHTPTHAARGYLDPEIVGAVYRENGLGSFVENHYVERRNPDRPLPEVNPNVPLPTTGEYAIRIKLVSRNNMEGVWVGFPDTGEYMDTAHPDELLLGLDALQAETLDQCMAVDVDCALPQITDILNQYDSAGELVRHAIDFGYVWAEQGQGEPHWLEKWQCVMELEDCHRLDLALDLAQNLHCYEFIPRGVDLAQYGMDLARKEGVLGQDSLLNECFDSVAYQDALEDMSNEAVEYVRGIPVVKTFGQTIFSFKKFKDSIDRYRVWVIAYTKELRLPMMLYTAAVNGVFVFLIAGALVLTRDGVTQEFLLNLIFYIIITPIISVTLTRIMFQSENAMIVDDALQRIDSVLDLRPLKETDCPRHPRDSTVELSHIHFSYDGKNEVLKDISLTIPAGQRVALVGPSGGGKTTLANVIARFFDPQGGSVKIGGADVRDIPKEELMDTISFVFQNSRLVKASILENVRMGRPGATDEEVLAALENAQCGDILKKLPNGADTVIGARGVYLSGGEQQRIAIARVMLKDAPILILDEATAFADPDNEARVQAALSRLSQGKTVIMIAHRLSTAVNLDQIYVIRDGEIAERGTSRELLARGGLFSRMWSSYQTSIQWKVAKEA